MNKALLIILAIALAAGFSLFLLTTGETTLDERARTATLPEVTEATSEPVDTPDSIPETAEDSGLVMEVERVPETTETERAVTDSGPASTPAVLLAATSGHPPYPFVTANSEGNVILPTDTLADYEAEYFTYADNGNPVEFFIIKTATGIIRAAFNACGDCYLEKQGFTQVNRFMVCNFCGQQFPVDAINIEEGTCSPISLDRHRLGGNQLQIKVDDIIRGAPYF